jgi:hypothetical protein
MLDNFSGAALSTVGSAIDSRCTLIGQLQKFPLKPTEGIPATKGILPFTPRGILPRVLF